MTELTQAMKDDAAAQDYVVEVLGAILDKTIQCNDQQGRKSGLVVFDGNIACPVSPSAYLKRIIKYGQCSPCCLVIGIIYLQRLKRRTPSLRLTSYNVQRLLLTSTMVASKFFDDFYQSNKLWAQIGNLGLKELNTLELTLLIEIKFDLSVGREDYQQYLAAVGRTVNKEKMQVRPLKTSTVVRGH